MFSACCCRCCTSGLGSIQAASSKAGAAVLSADEQATLLQYAKDTWRGFDKLLLPSSLPADGLRRDGEGWAVSYMQTSPTDIAAYLWSVLAAERLHLISVTEARSRLDRTLTTLAGMDRTNGFFVNELDPRTGAVRRLSAFDSRPPRLRISAVDNAWLAVALDDGRQRPAVPASACEKTIGPDGFSVLL